MQFSGICFVKKAKLLKWVHRWLFSIATNLPDKLLRSDYPSIHPCKCNGHHFSGIPQNFYTCRFDCNSAQSNCKLTIYLDFICFSITMSVCLAHTHQGKAHCMKYQSIQEHIDIDRWHDDIRHHSRTCTSMHNADRRCHQRTDVHNSNQCSPVDKRIRPIYDHMFDFHYLRPDISLCSLYTRENRCSVGEKCFSVFEERDKCNLT